MKSVVGIVPVAKLFETDDYFQDRYSFVNNYGARIASNGGIPVGLVGIDGYAIHDALSICDAFVMCGGTKIFPYHFQVVQHAVKEKKPLLGVCLGMQVIHSYFIVEDEAKKRGYSGDLLSLYETMKQEQYMFTLPVEHHWDVHMVRDNVDETKHAVRIVPNTHLYSLMGREIVFGASMHRYKISDPSHSITAAGYTEDGTIEAIEYKDFILGVQFHPEVDKSFDSLFRFLTEY